MMQRYIVFLNDKAVIVHQNINMPSESLHELTVKFTGSAELEKAYGIFCLDPGITTLKILATDSFKEACETFGNLFRKVKAAGGIVRNHNEEYLFIKRLGVWDLPKGKLHKSESKEAGALREVTEETGLTGLKITRQLPSTFHIYTDRSGREVLKETFWFEMNYEKEEKPVPQTEEDITEVRWFSGQDLHIPLQSTYASLKHLLEDYLKQQF
jgi:8-oxo-dGTP pyrophosphatase MutT (NUDIX family)